MNGPRDATLPRWQRSLLPAALLGADATADGSVGGGPARSPRDWLVDTAMFGLSALVGTVLLITDLHTVGTALAVVDIALGAAACLSLWMRRRRPLEVGLGTVLASALSGLAGIAAIAGVFTVAVHCPPRRTALLAALAVLASFMNSLLYRAPNGTLWSSVLFGVVETIVAVGYGLFVRAQRELVRSLHERSHRLQAEQELRLREARHAERTRIAREMHDVLAHRISLLSVHAGALEFNPDATREQIEQAAGVIRRSARAAQEELRAVIGVLRDDEEDDALAPPQPTLTGLEELVDESRRAGQDVTVTLGLDPAALPDRIGRTIYRLVQEALTNARKHATGQPVAIVIAGDIDGDIAVEVVNRPLVGRATSAPAAADSSGAGAGLIGLAERVTLTGGALSHEPLPGGGFAVRATLPWPPEEVLR